MTFTYLDSLLILVAFAAFWLYLEAKDGQQAAVDRDDFFRKANYWFDRYNALRDKRPAPSHAIRELLRSVER